jgi:plasmid stabilization system protein ParE
MVPATVRFHPAAAQEAESAYDWYAARNVSAAHAFREELRYAVDAVGNNPLTWPRHGRRARRYLFPRFPSAWCTGCALMKSRSSPLLTAGVGRAIGGPGSDRPSNFRIQRPALRAAGDRHGIRFPEDVTDVTGDSGWFGA